MNQYLASQGYVVLRVNYRSGIGYGLHFREAVNYGASGASEFNDVMGAGLYLKRARRGSHAHRLWGGSYGGYLTAMGSRAAPICSPPAWISTAFTTGAPEIRTLRPTTIRAHGRARMAFEIVAHGVGEDVAVAGAVDPRRRRPQRDVHPDRQAGGGSCGSKGGIRRVHFPRRDSRFLLRRDWARAYAAGAEFLGRKLGSAAKRQP